MIHNYIPKHFNVGNLERIFKELVGETLIKIY